MSPKGLGSGRSGRLGQCQSSLEVEVLGLGREEPAFGSKRTRLDKSLSGSRRGGLDYKGMLFILMLKPVKRKADWLDSLSSVFFFWLLPVHSKLANRFSVGLHHSKSVISAATCFFGLHGRSDFVQRSPTVPGTEGPMESRVVSFEP